MRAGKLDRSITIERLVETIDEYGVARPAWVPIRTLRAQIIQASSEEFLRSAGIASESVVIFRIRFLESVTPADRIVSSDRVFDIKEVKEIGRRRGLEIRAVGGTGA